MKILNEYMTEMVAVVFENKGSIDKFVGDAIVAVFGSLIEVRNHAQHAVEGALGMLQRLSMPAARQAAEFLTRWCTGNPVCLFGLQRG